MGFRNVQEKLEKIVKLGAQTVIKDEKQHQLPVPYLWDVFRGQTEV